MLKYCCLNRIVSKGKNMKNLKFYLTDCNNKNYALGAYNFVNLETLKGICEGCKISNSPANLH